MDKATRKNYNRVMRANLLKAMDDYVRDVIGDDNVTDLWLSIGIADGDAETEEGLMEYTDLELFREMVRVFKKCLDKEE